jgi:hypothetical protein
MLSCQGALTCEIEASKTLRGLVPRRQDRHRRSSAHWACAMRTIPQKCENKHMVAKRHQGAAPLGAGATVVDDSRRQCRLGMRRPRAKRQGSADVGEPEWRSRGAGKKDCCVPGSDHDGLWGDRVMLRMLGGSRLRCLASRDRCRVCKNSEAAGSSVPSRLDPLPPVLLEEQEGTWGPGFRLTQRAAVVCRAAAKAPS